MDTSEQQSLTTTKLPDGTTRKEGLGTKSERRKAMPWVTAVIDDLRQNGIEVIEINARENGHSVRWRK